MARRTIVELTDDLDGSPANETVTFALDGTEMEIDLSTANAATLRDALQPFVQAARKAHGARRSGAAGTKPARDYDPKAVRIWADSNRIAVPARGRIPADVLAKFRAAGN